MSTIDPCHLYHLFPICPSTFLTQSSSFSARVCGFRSLWVVARSNCALSKKNVHFLFYFLVDTLCLGLPSRCYTYPVRIADGPYYLLNLLTFVPMQTNEFTCQLAQLAQPSAAYQALTPMRLLPTVGRRQSNVAPRLFRPPSKNAT
jgi:hypothetical protein